MPRKTALLFLALTLCSCSMRQPEPAYLTPPDPEPYIPPTGSSGDSSSAMARTASRKEPSSCRRTPCTSTVIYVPDGFPSARSPASLVISTRVTGQLFRRYSRATTPSISVVSFALSRNISRASSARSVRLDGEFIGTIPPQIG